MQEVIATEHLTKIYETVAGDITVLRDLSLSVPRGTVFGFLGPNGAGKTTTMKMLVGLAEPTSGTISVGGGNPKDRETRGRIGFMPESPSFYLYLTGEEFLDFVCDIFGIMDKEGRIARVLSEVNLTGAEKRQVRTYSKGMLQRLGFAQALINDPEILFLDEPLDGLDPLGRAEIKHIFMEEKRKGKTIFFNSHILSDVAEVCDVVGIIDKGSLIALGTPKEIARGHRDLEDAFVHIVRGERVKTEKTS